MDAVSFPSEREATQISWGSRLGERAKPQSAGADFAANECPKRESERPGAGSVRLIVSARTARFLFVVAAVDFVVVVVVIAAIPGIQQQ